jgi:hypothetical protein
LDGEEAMPYCYGCSAITGKDTEVEPEVQSGPDFDPESGGITASVRIANACTDCSSEIEESTFDLEGEVDVTEHQGEGHELTLEDVEWERTDRNQTKDRNGKPIKSYRYQRRFYGVSGEAVVSCSCQEEPVGSVVLEDEVQASGMESLQ